MQSYSNIIIVRRIPIILKKQLINKNKIKIMSILLYIYIYNTIKIHTINNRKTLVLLFLILLGIIILITNTRNNLIAITATAILLLFSNHWLTIYMLLELQTLIILLIIAQNKQRAHRIEARNKYFILRAFASRILLLGCLLLYNTTNEYRILSNYTHNYTYGKILITCILLFKLSARPFHIWIKDIYEGRTRKNIIILRTIPKITVLYILTTRNPPLNILLTSSILSVIIGTIGAINQNKIKRIIAYRRINNIGFILLGIRIDTLQRIQARILHTILYSFLTIRSLTILHKINTNKHLLIELPNNRQNNRRIPIRITIIFLSLAGTPPLRGFMGKWLLIQSTIKENLILIATLILITTTISTIYYLYICVFSFFIPKETKNKILITELPTSYSIAWNTFIRSLILLHPNTILLTRWEITTQLLNVSPNNFTSLY
uniref:NADH-ubiquinone oxidoreductase chain 2 n=1 Tax=Lophophysema eversa TaxID=1510205 RepID=A0A068LEK6_9METZ|nr:NADH dehydrogenase subunit 2 [Lophophysema eversa]